MKTLSKTSLASLMVAGALLSTGLASAARDIVSDTAPLAPRVEHEPPHRRGFHWVADHWDQTGSQWHHIRGHWEQ